jgi:hypothetical protein
MAEDKQLSAYGHRCICVLNCVAVLEKSHVYCLKWVHRQHIHVSVNGDDRSERPVLPLEWQMQESAAFILQPPSHEHNHQPAQRSTSSVHYLQSITLHKTPTVSISPPDRNHHASSPHVPPSHPLQRQRRQRPLQGCWHAARHPPSPSNTA